MRSASGCTSLGESLPVLSDDEFFLLVGSPSAHKNIEVAIAGFLRYRSSGGRARLILAGAAHASLAATTSDAVDERPEHRPRGG